MSLQNDLDVLNTHLNGLLREADIAPATQGMRNAIENIKDHVHSMIFNYPTVEPEPFDIVENTIKYDPRPDEELAEVPITEQTIETEFTDTDEDDSDNEFDSPTGIVDDVVTTSVNGTDNDDAITTESSAIDSSGDISSNAPF